MAHGARGATRQVVRQVREVRLRRPTWRQLAAGVPALALVASGTALAATGAGIDGAAVAQGTGRFPHRIEVPAQPQHEQATFLQSAVTAPLPALALPTGMTALPALGSVQGAPAASPTVVLDRSGIPAAALSAYKLAASLLQQADPACHLDWSVPAAIGRVESNHARFGGNQLDTTGVARPGIVGIPLNGQDGTARIMDTDQGRWDHDTTYDRAVGPMQFIPGTWRSVGQDADGRGTADPQDMNDAATAAGVYLCSGGADLGTDSGLYSAVYRYNQSDSYVRTVMNLAKAYRAGVTELPLSQLPAAHAAPAGGSSADSGFAPGGTTQASRPTGSTTTPPAQAGGTPSSPASGSSGSSSSSGSSGRTPSSTSTPPVVAAPSLPPVPAPVQSVSSAVSSVATQVVTTLQRVVLDPVTQLLGGVLKPLTDPSLPAPPSDLSKVFRTNSTALPLLSQACFVDSGRRLPIVGTVIYQQVRCPANTQ